MNKRINKIHKKTLRLVYKDETNFSFDDLLKKDKSVKMYSPKKSTNLSDRNL